MTCAIAFTGYFVLPNYPTTTKWVNDDEKKLAVARLLNGRDLEDEVDPLGHWEAFMAAIKDPKTWVR